QSLNFIGSPKSPPLKEPTSWRHNVRLGARRAVPCEGKPMQAFGGCTMLIHRLFVAQRRWRDLQAPMLCLVLLGLSISIASAQTPSSAQPGEHVYLLRGALNEFSLGMDEIAAKLQRHGIHTTVDNYLAWPTLAEQAAAEYKSGGLRTIILVGHSS